LTKNRIHILNTFIDNLSMQETLQVIQKSIASKIQLHHVVVNAGKIVAMQKDQQLCESVNNSNLINADGQAVVWASKVLKKPLKERVAGIDLMQNLVALAHDKGYKIYLLGAKQEVVQQVANTYKKQYNQDIVAGYRDGYFTTQQEPQVVEDIAASGAHMLFVAITSPIKENFLYKHRDILKGVHFIMGVGGSFDVVAGLTKRAPLWMQNAGLEWFYRFAQEPKRMWKRYLVGNSTFIYLVLKEKFKKA